jgi:hypothetical protein
MSLKSLPRTEHLPERLLPKQAPSLPSPPATAQQPAASVKHTGSRSRIREHVSDMTPEEKAKFEREFLEKIKPAVVRWCKVYDGHIPFRPEDVTPDKLREHIFPGSSVQGYGFVIDGTTLSVAEYHGAVFVDYLMSPAAKQLFQLPKNSPPPADVSVAREEILKLLRADSGTDFPPNEIAITPTSRSGAMNGGIAVDVGKELHAAASPLPKYSMVFGPDGNLACYMRDIGQ